MGFKTTKPKSIIGPQTVRKPSSLEGHFVYALLDPDTDEIRYVGETPDWERRQNEHCESLLYTYKEKTALGRWVRQLRDGNKKPKMTLLQECKSQKERHDAERKWIASCRTAGAKLLNKLEGGPPVSKVCYVDVLSGWLLKSDGTSQNVPRRCTPLTLFVRTFLVYKKHATSIPNCFKCVQRLQISC